MCFARFFDKNVKIFFFQKHQKQIPLLSNEIAISKQEYIIIGSF